MLAVAAAMSSRLGRQHRELDGREVDHRHSKWLLGIPYTGKFVPYQQLIARFSLHITDNTKLC
jgi:hypothetical protein